MRLHESPQIPLRTVPPFIALVGICADGVVILWVLPRFAREGFDGAVEGREDGCVGAEVGEEV